MLQWASGFNISCYLDSNNYPDPYGRFDVLLAVGAMQSITIRESKNDAWEQLYHFRKACADWLVGHFSYDLAEGMAGRTSSLADGIAFPAMFFFQPEILLLLKKDRLKIGLPPAGNESVARNIYEEINHAPLWSGGYRQPHIHWQTRMDTRRYLESVKALQQHLHRGDAYEINFCREFFAENIPIDPLISFEHLNRLSPAPFSVCYRIQDKYLLCSSPERFIQKAGSTVISQPMKGTISRGRDIEEDETRKQQLMTSAKEQSENVMAVDLVRNDLSQTAVPGTVRVKELFGVYSFPQVHQMVTTIASEVHHTVKPEQIIAKAFPMGSMTGAPKYRVLQLINEFECTRRGIFSGTVGYFTPEGDFDFNVVIRSLVYNAANKYLSYQTGSGITIYSNPEQELAECLLKAQAIQRAMGGS
jgi:para-aminobenzoate synthetase component 1